MPLQAHGAYESHSLFVSEGLENSALIFSFPFLSSLIYSPSDPFSSIMNIHHLHILFLLTALLGLVGAEIGPATGACILISFGSIQLWILLTGPPGPLAL